MLPLQVAAWDMSSLGHGEPGCTSDRESLVQSSQPMPGIPGTAKARPARDRPRRPTLLPRGSAAPGHARREPATDAAVTRVLIVDDHTVLAGALAFTIDGYPDLRCVAMATTLAEARTLVAQLQPDVVLLDVLLPDGNGIEAIPSLIAAGPGVRVLVLTGHTDVELLSSAASHGASGFLPKESPIGAVINAIRAAVSGHMLVDGPTLATILGRLADTSRRSTPAASGVVLTRRETDVLQLMGQGKDPQAVAHVLGISLNTCRGYQKTLLAKLGAHSQLEAVVIGTRLGLLPR